MPRLEKISYYMEPQVAIVPGSKTNGITGTVIDGSKGYDRVCHVIQVGSFGTNATFDAEIVESATSGGTYTMIANSGMVAITASGANKVILIDVPVNASKPYQKIRSTAATAAVDVSAIALCYNGSRRLGTSLDDVTQEIDV